MFPHKLMVIPAGPRITEGLGWSGAPVAPIRGVAEWRPATEGAEIPVNLQPRSQCFSHTRITPQWLSFIPYSMGILSPPP